MNDVIRVGLSAALAEVEWVHEANGLATAWVDQTLCLCLEGAGRAGSDIGGHLRRSFLGALGRGASPAAQAGRPCTWDPPCALDVFRREQLRGPRGDGLPKPFVIAFWPHGPDLIVELRVFGMAIDWSMAAFEAMAAGIGGILPWSKIMRGSDGPPRIVTRTISMDNTIATPAPSTVRVDILSPIDASGTDPISAPHTILARALRRADALSRWNGVALDPAEAAAIAHGLRALDYDLTNLETGFYASPNRHRQMRQDPTITGSFIVTGDLSAIWPVLCIAERAHIGRHAVEGLGRVRMTPLGLDNSEQYAGI